MLILSRFLHNAHWAVIIVGCLLCYAAVKCERELCKDLLASYLVFIAYMTLMWRKNNLGILRLTPFWAFRRFFTNPRTRIQIINNIWLYVPLGAMLYRLLYKTLPKQYIVFIMALISVVIEVLQYVLKIGYCETDDVICNCIGGLIGILICKKLYKWIWHQEI